MLMSTEQTCSAEVDVGSIIGLRSLVWGRKASLDEKTAKSILGVEPSFFAPREIQEGIGEDSLSLPRNIQSLPDGRVNEYYPGKGEKDMIAKEKTGIIVRIDDRAGFGYVCVEDSTRKYFFDFDSVPGYRGQSARDLKLRQGGRVRFQIQGEIVKSLVPLEPTCS
jgi:cold shock CspA family protein